MQVVDPRVLCQLLMGLRRQVGQQHAELVGTIMRVEDKQHSDMEAICQKVHGLGLTQGPLEDVAPEHVEDADNTPGGVVMLTVQQRQALSTFGEKVCGIEVRSYYAHASRHRLVSVHDEILIVIV